MKRLRILLASPEPEASDYGNGVTARRWAGILRELGHDVRVRPGDAGADDGERYDALVALHAAKSAPAVRAFHAARPGTPIVIALTGTDLYPDFATSGVDPAVLDLADRFVTLQALGVRQLPPRLRPRATVITQSLTAPPVAAPVAAPDPPGGADRFEVAFLAHARPVKDPLLPAAAARLLPAASRVHIRHAGGARDGGLRRALEDESRTNPRYTWLGALPRDRALDLLAQSSLLVLTSRQEGGANVVTEALALGVPVLSTRIPGSVGLLGEDYPGYFAVGDATGLAEALLAAESDRDGFLGTLRAQCAALRRLADPELERAAWRRLLDDLPRPTAPPATHRTTAAVN